RPLPFLVTPCHHAFHVECLSEWLGTKREDYECTQSTCPECRAECSIDTCIVILGQV
ncbi:hypothetical protein KIPB_016292, partial [Kipferlia bialata]